MPSLVATTSASERTLLGPIQTEKFLQTVYFPKWHQIQWGNVVVCSLFVTTQTPLNTPPSLSSSTDKHAASGGGGRWLGFHSRPGDEQQIAHHHVLKAWLEQTIYLFTNIELEFLVTSKLML